MRKPISKKLRFEVFKRDNFTCQYCGSVPPNIILEIDHIIPVVNNGTNDLENLVSSCFDCNRGKSSRSLKTNPLSTNENIERLKALEKQYKEFKKWNLKVKKLSNEDLESVDKIYQMYFEGFELTENFKKSSVRHFIDKLGITDVESNMHLACGKMRYEHHALKYFCGICWNKIKNK